MDGRGAAEVSTDRPSRLQEFTDEVFGHLIRADQRRWAFTYLDGLARVPGKKSIERMARAVTSSPTAAHGMRQFVNGSPWEWTPARRALGNFVVDRADPIAWVVRTCAIPKRGTHSVGVRRWPVDTGRALNCQVAVVLFLSTATVSIPIDWRLLLDDDWCHDARRQRARIPATVRPKPVRAHILDFVDSTIAHTNGVARPLIANLPSSDATALIPHLAERAQPFIVEIPTARPERWLIPHGRQIVTLPGRPGTSRHSVRTTTVSVPRQTGTPSSATRPYRLIEDHTARGRRARVWITDLVRQPTDEAMSLISRYDHSDIALAELRDDFGMFDFEGRSYPGWHHHMTLVSGAYTFSRIADTSREMAIAGDFATARQLS